MSGEAREMLDELLSIEDLCDYLGISRTTAYELVKQDDFPAFKLGSSWKIPAPQFKQWIRDTAGKRAS